MLFILDHVHENRVLPQDQVFFRADRIRSGFNRESEAPQIKIAKPAVAGKNIRHPRREAQRGLAAVLNKEIVILHGGSK